MHADLLSSIPAQLCFTRPSYCKGLTVHTCYPRTPSPAMAMQCISGEICRLCPQPINTPSNILCLCIACLQNLAYSVPPSLPHAAGMSWLSLLYAEQRDARTAQRLRCWALGQVRHSSL